METMEELLTEEGWVKPCWTNKADNGVRERVNILARNDALRRIVNIDSREGA